MLICRPQTLFSAETLNVDDSGYIRLVASTFQLWAIVSIPLTVAVLLSWWMYHRHYLSVHRAGNSSLRHDVDEDHNGVKSVSELRKMKHAMEKSLKSLKDLRARRRIVAGEASLV